MRVVTGSTLPALARPCLLRLAAALLCLCALPGGAAAHDTWFHAERGARPGEPLLNLGTGNQFPKQEFPVAREHVKTGGCRSGDAGSSVPLQPRRDMPGALAATARLKSPAANITCWAGLAPFDVELAPDKIALYLKEIHASPAVRARWETLRARGVAWQERYTKHSRIELRDTRARTQASATAEPVPMGMDVLLESGLKPLHPGDTLVFQVLRGGQPLPGLPVEFRSDLSPAGWWLRTDAEGRVRFQPPLAANWLLRGTDLRASATVPDGWESDFITLAFEVTGPEPSRR